MKRYKLIQYLDEYLHSAEFSDLGPNGLQVEGRNEIKKIVTAVSASVELFEKAVDMQADAVLVHHGIIWDFERPIYKGGYKRRVKLLLENEINLLAYHLPLDAHLEVGNNAVMARLLGLENIQPFGEYKGQYVGIKGELPGKRAEDLFTLIKDKIKSDPLIFPYGPRTVSHVGLISGGAQKEVKQAIEQGLDVFISGEVSEFVMHLVKEEGIHYVAAGHYATERFGVQALGEHLQEIFNLDTVFVDIPNPA
ncbi:MAG TPA: Nif3-like dinuclear metal center hexameric protein [Calditrichaeota bacterium]|nr:Nif3-like dinuclear metal center hexameric protein [Calditrichota bacterium]